jgi:ABC-type glycerol-3-phosphate transport system substrate-binding protein
MRAPRGRGRTEGAEGARLTRRAVLGAGGAGALLAACGGSSQSGAGPGAKALPPAVIDFYFFWNPARAEEWESTIVRPFVERHPGLGVNVIAPPGTPEFISKLVSLMTAGTPPDAMINNGWNARALAREGILQAADDLIKRDRVAMPRISPRMLAQTATDQGKTYFLPYAAGGQLVMLYNRRLFLQVGVSEPPADFKSAWGWDEWTGAMGRLAGAGSGDEVQRFGVDRLGNDHFIPQLWDGRWLSDDLKKAQADSAPVVEAFTRWYEAVSQRRVAPARGPTELNERFGAGPAAAHFINGRVATTVTGTGIFATLAPTDLDFALMPWPKPKVSSPELYPNSLGLVRGSTRREQAWAWVAYLYADARLSTFQGQAPMVPADAAAWAANALKSRPNARANLVAQGIEGAVAPDPFWDHPRSDQIRNELINPAIANIVAGRGAAADELRRIQAPMQTLIDRQ